MVKQIVRDIFFLGQPSEPATKADIQIGSHTNTLFPVRLQCVLQILSNLDICFCGRLGWLA